MAELPRRCPDHRRQHHAHGRRHQRSIACRKLWKARGIAKVIWPNEWLLVLLTAIAHHTLSCVRLKLWPWENAILPRRPRAAPLLRLTCARLKFPRLAKGRLDVQAPF